MFNSLRKQNKTHLNRTTMHFYIELRKKKNIEKIRTFTFFFFTDHTFVKVESCFPLLEITLKPRSDLRLLK